MISDKISSSVVLPYLRDVGMTDYLGAVMALVAMVIHLADPFILAVTKGAYVNV